MLQKQFHAKKCARIRKTFSSGILPHQQNPCDGAQQLYLQSIIVILSCTDGDNSKVLSDAVKTHFTNTVFHFEML